MNKVPSMLLTLVVFLTLGDQKKKKKKKKKRDSYVPCIHFLDKPSFARFKSNSLCVYMYIFVFQYLMLFVACQ